MNLLNFQNIVGDDVHPIIIGFLYLLPILIVSISFGINPKKPLQIFLYSFFLFLFLIVLFKYTITDSKNGGLTIDETFSKLKQFSSSLDNEIRLPISYTILIAVFMYILFSFVILFNSNRKNKAKYFFLNTIIQYSLFINMIIFVYVK